jgi:hypothetical protein
MIVPLPGLPEHFGEAGRKTSMCRAADHESPAPDIRQKSIAAGTASLSLHRKSGPATLEICQTAQRRLLERPFRHRNES